MVKCYLWNSWIILNEILLSNQKIMSVHFQFYSSLDNEYRRGEQFYHNLNQHCFKHIFSVNTSNYNVIHLKIIKTVNGMENRLLMRCITSREPLSHSFFVKWVYSGNTQWLTVLFGSSTSSTCLCMIVFWLWEKVPGIVCCFSFKYVKWMLVYFGRRQETFNKKSLSREIF